MDIITLPEFLQIFKNKKDIPIVENILLHSKFPFQIINVDLCRDNLMVEIEALPILNETTWNIF